VGALLAGPVLARDLHVGPDRELQLPSQAARIARDGDRVLIDAGEYRGDAAVWRADGLRIEALGGPVLLRADGAHAEGKAIWVIKGRNTWVEGIAFEGAARQRRRDPASRTGAHGPPLSLRAQRDGTAQPQ
jgi:hypothetical protein